MIAVDKNGIVTIFNNAASKLTKIASEDALGKNIKKVIDNTRLPEILKTGKAELNKKQPLRDNTIITNRMPVKDESGKIVGAIAVFREITEIQKLQQEIRNLKYQTITAEIKYWINEKGINLTEEQEEILINRMTQRFDEILDEEIEEVAEEIKEEYE